MIKDRNSAEAQMRGDFESTINGLSKRLEDTQIQLDQSIADCVNLR